MNKKRRGRPRLIYGGATGVNIQLPIPIYEEICRMATKRRVKPSTLLRKVIMEWPDREFMVDEAEIELAKCIELAKKAEESARKCLARWKALRTARKMHAHGDTRDMVIEEDGTIRFESFSQVLH